MEESSSQDLEDFFNLECDSKDPNYSFDEGDEVSDTEQEEEEDYDYDEEDIQNFFDQEYDALQLDSKKDNDKACWSEFQDRRANFSYSGAGGLKSPLPQDINPENVLRLILDDELLTLIVTETNRYAVQSSHKWKPINKEELLKYLALIMWMGLVKIGKISDYWSTDPMYKNSVASNTMPRGRFDAIARNIHFANNELIESSDRLGKIQPLIDKLQSNFQKIYTPEENIVVDESIVPWRGRLSFKQYIPAKANKYGIKVYKLCSIDGYCWSLQVYGGANSTLESKEVGQALNVCKNLTKGLRNEGRTLYVDNFYTSYPLAKYFLEEKTHVVGTLRANRAGMPKEVFEKQLKKGEMISREDQNGIVVLKWRDTRDVKMLSTKHKPEMKQVTSGHQTKMKPTAIIDYNKGKVGIDLSDQMASYASSLRKGLKWYRKLSVGLLLGVSVVNAYILYKKVKRCAFPIRDFREKIVTSLLGLSRKRELDKLPAIYSMHYLSEAEDKSSYTRRRCIICYEKLREEFNSKIAGIKAKKVNTFCTRCSNRAFCIPCFAEYHAYK